MELPKIFEPKKIEQKWYPQWESGGYFKPKKGKANQSFCIIMPPPNVTGVLHAGHALDVLTQDALIRFKRMKGFEALWLPGSDHAGIATQSVVEKQMMEEQGKSRHDITREEFLEKIWQWKEEKGGRINLQQRTLGASPDWDYSMFTMDSGPNAAVKKFFVDMYNQGLIYQSDYIVNWDPHLQSAISDAEVEHKEVKGAFYHIKYSIKGSDQFLEVATTRPETMFGDTAISVHPDDERFQKFIGKTAIIPLKNKEIPIIADEHVDREKGTGCLKVTPGHDFNDFEIGKRHQLPIVNILNKDGTLNGEALEFEGQTCLAARKKLVEKLEHEGFLLETKEHTHQVGHGDRSKVIIEPMVSKQWFLNVQEMAKIAVNAVEKDKTKFYPKQWENTYFSWLREPKDWCISRQLIWGHQIPVFYCKDCQHQWALEEAPTECSKCQSTNIHQDPDVLDTWFSSGLWPMSTLGWPCQEKMKEKGFDRFFPSSVLVTGFDIIFFWVARMMMMSLKAEKQVPFHKVYIHAIVRDKYGRKMSKSLGNGIDPIDMVDKYGADAFRFTLASGSGYNRNINLDPDRIEGFRNFVNKIWNAFRFVSPFLDNASDQLPSLEELDHHERWILSELNSTAKIMNESMEEFRYDDSCSALYQFIYERFCSWFIEISKKPLYSDDNNLKTRRATVLRFSFKNIVALLHPFCPYITEEIWGYLKSPKDDLLIVTDYPEFTESLDFTTDQQQMNQFIEVVSLIRNLRAQVQIKPKEEIAIHFHCDDNEINTYFKNNEVALKEMARVSRIEYLSKSDQRAKKSVMAATTFAEVMIPLEGVIDLTSQIARLEKEKQKVSKELEKYTKKLSNKGFTEKAKPEVIFETQEKANNLKEKLQSVESMLDALSS